MRRLFGLKFFACLVPLSALHVAARPRLPSPRPFQLVARGVPARMAASAMAASATDEKLPPSVLPITLTVLAQMIGEGIALTSLPLHMAALGASTVQTGVAVSAFSLSSVLFTPVVVKVSTKVGRTKVLRACLLGCVFAQLVIVQASRPAGVVLGRFVAGIFAASVPVAQAAVTDLVGPSQSALALSRVAAVSQLGVVVGPAIGAAIGALLMACGVPNIAGRHMRCVFACSAAFALSVLVGQVALGDQGETAVAAAAAAAPRAAAAAPQLEAVPTQWRRDSGQWERGTIDLDGKRTNNALPLSLRATEAAGSLPLAAEVRKGRELAQWALRLTAVALGWGLTLSMATYCLFGSAMVGYTQTQLSINFSLAAALTVATQLVLFPRVIKRLGEHLVCALGLALSAAGLGAFSLTKLNPAHAILYLISRMGNALGDTACATLVARASDGSEARARNLGMIYSVRAGARIVTPLARWASHWPETNATMDWYPGHSPPAWPDRTQMQASANAVVR